MIGLLATIATILTMTMVVAAEQFYLTQTSETVDITDMQGIIQFAKSPYDNWQTSGFQVQAGVEWRASYANLTLDFAGDVNITWSLLNSFDDSIMATINQSIVTLAGVPMLVIAAEGISTTPYNWGQHTISSNMTVYIEAELFDC